MFYIQIKELKFQRQAYIENEVHNFASSFAYLQTHALAHTRIRYILFILKNVSCSLIYIYFLSRVQILVWETMLFVLF
jgi:hypothetical protein